MTPLVFAFYLTHLFLGKMAQTTDLKFSSSAGQESIFISVQPGDNLTLQCFYEGDVAARHYWYKQNLGHQPRLISSFHLFGIDATFYDEFKDNPRFKLDNENSQNHLIITDMHVSDSATYYCMSSYLYTLEFSESIVISVQGSGLNIPALVHQSASESIQPGGSVTLNCTVHTGTCDGEHSVYWFKDFKESHPGLIYTHGGRSDQCERKPNTQRHTCVYNLSMKSLNLSHAGTYYCAVASCGHILFGNGTKLDFEDGLASEYFWTGVSVFTSILVVILALSVCMMSKRHSCQPKESPDRSSAASMANTEGCNNVHNLYYAALNVNLANGSRGQRDQIWSTCVYNRVKQEN